MKIIYVMDPYDGWCYAGSETLLRLYMRYRGQISFEVLPAGMLTGELTCQYQPAMADATLRSLRQIEKATGAKFGEGHKKALRTQSFTMDSEMPSRALTACRIMAPEQSVPFSHALLHARFNHGMDLNDAATYLELCEILDISKQRFFEVFTAEGTKAQTLHGFALADQLAEHYPTLLFLDGDQVIRLSEGHTPLNLLQLRIERILRGEVTGLEEE